MAEQLLRNPDIKPTEQVIAECLGAANAAYLNFIERLKEHDIDLEWRYYTDGKAWLGKGLYKWTGARGGLKEVTAFWLSIWGSFFKVTIYIPEKSRLQALDLPLDSETKSMVEDSKQMGKLKLFPLTFDVRSDERFDAIYKLIDFRKLLK